LINPFSRNRDAGFAARSWVLALVLVLLFGVSHARAEPAGKCAADSKLAYVCDAQKPEDLQPIAGTRWLIASGYAPGAGLKLVDLRTRGLTQWYTGAPAQIAFDRAHYPQCASAPDPTLFSPHGLSLHAVGRGRWRLHAVNHAWPDGSGVRRGREAIEVFDVATGAGLPRLTWRGCLPLPPGQVANSVGVFADGTVLVTVLTRPGTAIADFVQGRVTGGVWQWQPGERGFTLLPGTELPGNNGIETDPDQRHFYVVAFGWHAVVVYDRRDTAHPLARIVAADFMPDNIHWSAGRLLVAGMRLDEPACGGLRKVIDGVADGMLCHRGWTVGSLNLAARRLETVAEGPPQPGFNGVSTAAIAGGELWLGSYQSARLARVIGWTPAHSVKGGQ
jgi:hypothetical protein